MPQLVTREVVATEVKKGDRFDWNDKTYVAGSVSRKIAYVHVDGEDTGDGARTVRVPIDATVTVTRTEATEEEMAARRLEWQTDLVRTRMEGIDAAVVDAQNTLVANLQYAPHCHECDYARYVRVQTEQGIWRNVARWLEREPESGLVGIVRKMIDELVEELVRSSFVNGSSDGMRRTVDGIELQAKADWVRDLRFSTR